MKSGSTGSEWVTTGSDPLSGAQVLTQQGQEKVGQGFGGETPPRDISPRTLLAEFLESCRAEGRSPRSLKEFRTRVPKLFAYLEEHGLDFLSLRPKEAQGYVGWLSSYRTAAGTVYTARSVAAAVKTARAFCDYLRKRGIAASNPFAETRRVRPEKKLPRGILKEAEMERLLEELGRFDECGHLKAVIGRYRAHVVAELQYATGLRVSEVAGLSVADVDFSRSLVHVRGGKGGYERIAYLGEYAREVLRLYVERVREKSFNASNRRNDGLLFGARYEWLGKAMSQELEKACTEASLPRIRSHGFRHAMGSHLLHSGCPIRYIQSLLGHRHLKNTEVYTKVEKEDLKEVVDRCHPRRWKEAERGSPGHSPGQAAARGAPERDPLPRCDDCGEAGLPEALPELLETRGDRGPAGGGTSRSGAVHGVGATGDLPYDRQAL
jgi:site-specific recombinase XerD